MRTISTRYRGLTIRIVFDGGGYYLIKPNRYGPRGFHTIWRIAIHECDSLSGNVIAG